MSRYEKDRKKTGKKIKEYPRYFIPDKVLDPENHVVLAKVGYPGAEIFYIWDDDDSTCHHTHPKESDANEYVKRGKWIEIPFSEAVLVRK